MPMERQKIHQKYLSEKEAIFPVLPVRQHNHRRLPVVNQVYETQVDFNRCHLHQAVNRVPLIQIKSASHQHLEHLCGREATLQGLQDHQTDQIHSCETEAEL